MEAMVSSLMSPFLLLPKPLSVHGRISAREARTLKDRGRPKHLL